MLLERCLLFTPANHPERFEKAKTLDADGLIIDLENAISLAEKESARKTAIEYLKIRAQKTRFVQCLRINSIRMRAELKDLSTSVRARQLISIAHPDFRDKLTEAVKNLHFL